MKSIITKPFLSKFNPPKLLVEVNIETGQIMPYEPIISGNWVGKFSQSMLSSTDFLDMDELRKALENSNGK